MEKKMIGYRLIKLYPGHGQLIGYEMLLSQEQMKIYNYKDWPEFWEPIYGVGINLRDIYNYKVRENNHIDDMVLSSMKEACKQTLELVCNNIQLCISSAEIIEVDKGKIRKLIDKIK